MRKITTITLPEKMIEQIDEMLLEKDFVSRSDFIRHLARIWFTNQKKFLSHTMQVGEVEKEKGGEQADKEVDLEYGIPPDIIKEIEEEVRAKIKN